MASVFEIVNEQDSTRGWAFHVQVTDESGILAEHTLELSWADYNLWSPDGSDPPSAVAEAVLAFWFDRLAESELPERFNAAVTRRMEPQADELIPRYIQPADGSS